MRISHMVSKPNSLFIHAVSHLLSLLLLLPALSLFPPYQRPNYQPQTPPNSELV